MSRYIIIRETGENSLLLIDKENGRVEVVDPNALGLSLEQDDNSTGENTPQYSGIELAISLNTRGEATSRMFYNADCVAA